MDRIESTMATRASAAARRPTEEDNTPETVFMDALDTPEQGEAPAVRVLEFNDNNGDEEHEELDGVLEAQVVDNTPGAPNFLLKAPDSKQCDERDVEEDKADEGDGELKFTKNRQFQTVCSK